MLIIAMVLLSPMLPTICSIRQKTLYFMLETWLGSLSFVPFSYAELQFITSPLLSIPTVPE